MFPQLHVEIREKLWNKLPFIIFNLLRFFLLLLLPPAHLSITARHSFLQVKRLPRRSRKVPGAVVMGGGVCLHSISSIGNGAGRMFRVAPAAESLVSYNWRRCICQEESSHNQPREHTVCRCVCAVEAQRVPVKSRKKRSNNVRRGCFDELSPAHSSQKAHPFMEMHARRLLQISQYILIINSTE